MQDNGILLSKGGETMNQKQETWLFLQLRAAQLFEEGDSKGALRLMKQINREQQKRFFSRTEKTTQSMAE